MKIEIEVEDLSKFIDAYNHAIITFDNNIRGPISFGLEHEIKPVKILEALKNKVNREESLCDIITDECTVLKNVYDQLIEIEKEVNKW